MKKLLLVMLLISTPCYAGLITHTDYTGGNTITAAGQNANENTIVNVINGNLDSSNIASGGITGTNIAAGTILTGNIAGSTILGSNIAKNTVGNGNIIASTITNVSIASGTIRGSRSTSVAGTTYNEISTGSISTQDMFANAISTSGASGTTGGGNQAVFLDSVTLTTSGGPVLVMGYVVVAVTNGGSTGGATCTVTHAGGGITGGTSVDFYSPSGQIWYVKCPILAYDTPTAGSNVYTFTYALTGTASSPTVQNHSLVVFELKR